MRMARARKRVAAFLASGRAPLVALPRFRDAGREQAACRFGEGDPARLRFRTSAIRLCLGALASHARCVLAVALEESVRPAIDLAIASHRRATAAAAEVFRARQNSRVGAALTQLRRDP